ncbi:DivIVA domain-containing protein [Nesterenkonia lacusekhoensis]|nr:DivIVA domain-containing protein [Nesterenkonia lacusekhoensis]
MWLYLAALAILGVIVLLLMGRWEGVAAPEEESGAALQDFAHQDLSAGAITPEHLEEVRFDSALRGYRMDQVDALLDALAQQLRETRAETRTEDVQDARSERSEGPHPEADEGPRNDPR